MLRKFSVENFKGFRDKITLDIGSRATTVLIQKLLKMDALQKELSTVLTAAESQTLDWLFLTSSHI